MNEEQNINQLPKDWVYKKLYEVGKVINGDRGRNYPSRAHYVSSGVPFISAGNIDKNFVDVNNLNYITEEKYRLLNSGKLINGDIIYCLRGSLGKCAIFTLEKGAISSSLCILRLNNDVITKYVYYYLCSPLSTNEIRKHDNGTAQPNLSAKNFSSYLIPKPSIKAQLTIVSKIEELFSELDKGIENLRTAQQQLKTYRQSVLKWAFEKLKNENTIEDITESSLIGLVRSSKDQNDDSVGVPYVKMNNMDLNGNIDFSELVYVAANKSEIERFHLKKGDILINTRNSFELVGKTGIVREEKTNAVFNNNLLRLRVKNNFVPLFIGYQLINPSLKSQMLKEKKATTNVCALYQRDIFPLRVKVCGIEEQNKIVQEIESRLSVANKMEESISQSLQQAEALRQSILKKAFEGRLIKLK